MNEVPKGNSLIERLETEIKWKLELPHAQRQYYLIQLLQDALDQIRRQ